jgi:hypothetical protein
MDFIFGLFLIAASWLGIFVQTTLASAVVSFIVQLATSLLS